MNPKRIRKEKNMSQYNYARETDKTKNSSKEAMGAAKNILATAAACEDIQRIRKALTQDDFIQALRVISYRGGGAGLWDGMSDIAKCLLTLLLSPQDTDILTETVKLLVQRLRDTADIIENKWKLKGDE
jgi:hypothetical protein